MYLVSLVVKFNCKAVRKKKKLLKTLHTFSAPECMELVKESVYSNHII